MQEGSDMRLKKQQLFILSVITAVSVCAGSFPSYAEANENFADTGLCAHHSEHTEACGYAAPGEESPCSYGVNGCAYCVVSWEWPEDQQILTESDGNWGLALPGASENNPVTRDNLGDLLPDQITAVTDSGESLPLEISWDLTALPESGAWEGEYILTADLVDGDYALTEDAILIMWRQIIHRQISNS